MANDGKGMSSADDAAKQSYGDELLSASWNPVIALLGWSCARTGVEASRDRAPAVREEDADDFLGRFYESGA
jgi:hypothetical protein